MALKNADCRAGMVDLSDCPGLEANGFDLRALGWVVTRDLITELVRTALGRTRRVPLTTLRDIAERWRVVQASQARGVAASPLLLSLATPLPKAGVAAMAGLVLYLATRLPHRYGESAMRARCRSDGATFGTAAAAGAALLALAPDFTIVVDAAWVLMALACWKSVTTFQTWLAYRLVKRVSRISGVSDAPVALHGAEQPEERIG